MNRRTVLLLVGLVGAAIALANTVDAPLGRNYVGSSLGVNRTGDAVQALATGRVGRFFATQPPIGPGTVVIRAPFAALAGISHDLVALPPRYHGDPPLSLPPPVYASQRTLYRYGLFPCLVALVAMAAAGASVLDRFGRPWTVQLLVAALMLALPVWKGGISYGHPDEFLTAGLTIGAVLAAGTGRWKLAASLLGVALASKQWALLALPATVLAAPRQARVRTAVLSVGLYAAIMSVMAIGNPDRFMDAMTAPSLGSHNYVDALSVWFPIAPHHDVTVFDGVKDVTIPHRHLSHRFESALHPAMVVVAWLLSLAFALRRRDWNLAQVFQLLALIFLVRCMFQTGDKNYYHAAFIASLALYEGLAGRMPILTLVVTAALLPDYGPELGSLQRANALYLAWSIPMLVYLGWSVLGKERPARLLAAAEAVGGRSYGT